MPSSRSPFFAGLASAGLAFLAWPVAVLHGHGSFHERLEALSAALREKPDDPVLLYRLAAEYLEHGDWETALGGASHLGRRDIAEYLIEQGARVDLFAATMLGQLDVVKALLTLQPKLIDAKGPHGFSLHWHAHMGGEKAKELLDHLQGIKKVELPKPMKK